MTIWNILCTAIWYNLWPSDIVCGHLVYFSHFGMLEPIKSGNPGQNRHFLPIISAKYH
jgi:hypothetical protein